ncbi:MAG: hemolysin family protein [Acidobacteriota bacterium]
MTALFLYVGLSLSVSFLCSLLEATLLSARRAELVERRQAGDRGAAQLLELKEDRIDDAISSILILNTFAHTIGSFLAGTEAEKLFGSTIAGVFAFVLTLAVLVFTEIIPKTLGTVYASQLVGFVARTVKILMKLLWVVLQMTRLLTRLVAARAPHRATVSRGELAALVTIASREGTLPAADSHMLSNVLQINEIPVEDVMTPRTVITMASVGTPIDEFLADDRYRSVSRIPIFEDTPDNVTGIILQRDVLHAAASGADRAQTTVDSFQRPALFLPEGQPVSAVLRRLIERREHMALVTDEYGGISGLVTIEDLVETALGMEILDESDRVVDLRAEAVRLREQRLSKLQRWRAEMVAEYGDGDDAADAEAPGDPASEPPTRDDAASR